MKKIYTLCILGVALLLASCSDQRAVHRTANAFLQNFFVDNNFEGAKVFSTQATHANIDDRALTFHWNPNAEDIRFRRFEITGSEIRTTRAVVFYTLDDDVQRRLNLTKREGRWLVDMPEAVSFSPDFSLSPVHTEGGFAGAKSEFFRIGDIPYASETQKKSTE